MVYHKHIEVKIFHVFKERHMDTVYYVSDGILVLEGGQSIPTYGIAAKDNGSIISEFSDVSINKSFTEKVVKLLNDCRVEPCHFYDVVIDELNR